MASTWGDNFQYEGRKPDFVRQQYEHFSDMVAVKDNKMPEMYFAYCLEDRKFYSYDKRNEVDPVLGKFRLFESGSGGGGSAVDVMPEPGESWVGKIVQYIGLTSGDFEQGYFYICNATDHYEELPIESMDKMKEQIALNGELVILRNPLTGEYNTKALEKDGVYYFVQDDVIYSGTKSNVVVETLDELKGLIENSSNIVTVETPNGTRHELNGWSYNNKWYFELNTLVYQGDLVNEILKDRSQLWLMVADSSTRVTIEYAGGTSEERNAYIFESRAYFISSGQLYGGNLVDGNKVYFADANILATDEDVEAEGIILGQIIYLADCITIDTDEQVVALELVMRQVIDFDSGVNPRYTTDEQVAAIGLTWIWDQRTYSWDLQPVSPSGEEPGSIPISDIDSLFD